ncbi:MAG: DMT family transporter [Candidatus Krumholzibacteria bacterium]|nr:DMT family transporter [Candidatus Krumholzibacteria bacterium]
MKSEILLLTASAIWGFAFVAQRVGMEHVGPFIFNGIRFALGTIVLIPLAIRSVKKGGEPATRSVFLIGVIAGLVLFFGASLQQTGLVYTTAGKAGFITGLYVVLVPILGIAVRQKTGAGTWAGVLLAGIGLYLLSFTGRFTIGKGDLLVLGGTFFWATHVLLIGAFIKRINPLVLAATQFSVCSILSIATSLLTESNSVQGVRDAAIPILYGGLLSVAIAYTLQLLAQRDTPPSHAAIILSLETVFAAVGGWLILSEVIPMRGLFGCVLMLVGILVSQLGVRRGRGKSTEPCPGPGL